MNSLFDPEPPADPSGGPGTPLAARMRPRDLSEFVGQEHLLGARCAARSSRDGRTR
jgi:putative ATPase